jgi:hypothetical protein
MPRPKQFIVDPQTGQVSELKDETRLDTATATFSIAYLLVMLGFFAWQFLDIFTGQMMLLNWIITNPERTECLGEGACLVIVYAIIGGGLGGTINGLRSILNWHAERQAFSSPHTWRYIALPWLGATLATFVYALMRAGADVIGGDNVTGNDTAIQFFSAFAIGTLSGYGSFAAFKWLDARVAKLFKISDVPMVKIPDLKDKTDQDAERTLQELQLNIKAHKPTNGAGKVVSQTPSEGQKVPKGSVVDITIADWPQAEGG